MIPHQTGSGEPANHGSLPCCAQPQERVRACSTLGQDPLQACQFAGLGCQDHSPAQCGLAAPSKHPEGGPSCAPQPDLGQQDHGRTLQQHQLDWMLQSLPCACCRRARPVMLTAGDQHSMCCLRLRTEEHHEQAQLPSPQQLSMWRSSDADSRQHPTPHWLMPYARGLSAGSKAVCWETRQGAVYPAVGGWREVRRHMAPSPATTRGVRRLELAGFCTSRLWA